MPGQHGTWWGCVRALRAERDRLLVRIAKLRGGQTAIVDELAGDVLALREKVAHQEQRLARLELGV